MALEEKYTLQENMNGDKVYDDSLQPESNMASICKTMSSFFPQEFLTYYVLMWSDAQGLQLWCSCGVFDSVNYEQLPVPLQALVSSYLQ